MSSNAVTTTNAKSLMEFMGKHRTQIAAALPAHITPDRMMRLALTSFSQNRALQNCDMNSIFASVVIAAQLGLEIGVGGQGYLVPYKGKATFVPGWQGLVDLVSRAGRATVWTGAVYKGDEFDWALGDSPFVKHRPMADSDNPNDIEFVYAVGRVNGSHYPVIEVWTMNRIIRHLNRFNKVGASHYALANNSQNMEMYARKVALLQVLKYMPKSVEVQRAMDVSNAIDSAKTFTIDGDIVVVHDEGDGDGDQAQPAQAVNQPRSRSESAATTKQQQDQPAEKAAPQVDKGNITPLGQAKVDYLESKMAETGIGYTKIKERFDLDKDQITEGTWPVVLAFVKGEMQ